LGSTTCLCFRYRDIFFGAEPRNTSNTTNVKSAFRNCHEPTTHSTRSDASAISKMTTRTPSATYNQPTQTRLSTVPTSASKSRQLSHLHAQLAQLTANMSDLENLLRMTAVQAEGMRGLGGYVGGM